MLLLPLLMLLPPLLMLTKENAVVLVKEAWTQRVLMQAPLLLYAANYPLSPPHPVKALHQISAYPQDLAQTECQTYTGHCLYASVAVTG
jgi:hypothetical protein